MFHRRFLERYGLIFRAGLVEHITGVWWFVRSKECKGKSLTPSCGDGGFDLGNGMHEEFKTVSGNVCNRLFSTGEDGFGTRGITSI